MPVRDDELLSYVVERDIDLMTVQMIQTSQEFREWFISQVDLDPSGSGFFGVRQSVTTETGESDIVLGVKTSQDEYHIVLIENKIDASMQDRQVERYFERGENYTNKDDWDKFTVCLIAPERYVGKDERKAFEAIVSYEDIMDKVESIDHDASEFFLEIFRQSLRRRTPTDNSELTTAVGKRIFSKLGEESDMRLYKDISGKHVSLESTHEDHPWFILYNVYIPGPHDGDKAIVRVNLTGRDGISKQDTEKDRELIRPVFSENRPDGFEHRGRPMDIVAKSIFRDDFDSQEEYIDNIAGNLYNLIEFYHPRLIQETPVDNTRDGDRSS